MMKRLKNLGGVDICKDCLKRIREFRASKSVLQAGIWRFTATSIDYDHESGNIHSVIPRRFRTKFIMPIHGQTGAESYLIARAVRNKD